MTTPVRAEPTIHSARSAMRGRCLTLNASYEPLTLVSVQRAIRLVLDGKAEVVEAYTDRPVRSETETLKAPAVIRLVQFVKVPRKFRRNVTNVFLFSRDGYCCAYCGRHRKELGKRDGLTRDHVIPQSRFATKAEANTWGNVVTACGRCNRRKADRTPKEAGMPLRTRPTTPHFVRLEWAVRRLTPLQRKYVVRFFGEEVARLMDQR